MPRSVHGVLPHPTRAAGTVHASATRGGRGTTRVAAERTGSIGRRIELDPYDVDAASGRWQARTGKPAVHVESGRSFDELAAQGHDKAA